MCGLRVQYSSHGDNTTQPVADQLSTDQFWHMWHSHVTGSHISVVNLQKQADKSAQLLVNVSCVISCCKPSSHVAAFKNGHEINLTANSIMLNKLPVLT